MDTIYIAEYTRLYTYTWWKRNRESTGTWMGEEGRTAQSVHGKHAACLWRWFLEVDVVARTLLFQISEPAAAGDVETRRAWRIESLKRNVYRENHDQTGKIESLQQGRIEKIYDKNHSIRVRGELFPLILRNSEVRAV